jgi:hypothetical protein
MKNCLDKTVIVTDDELEDISSAFKLKNYTTELEDCKYNLITFDPKDKYTNMYLNSIKSDRFFKNLKKFSDNSEYTPDICTHISSAIAAYSRIAIHEFKMYAIKNGCSVIYSDTDSIYLDKPLPKNCEYINKSLGGIKLEVNNKSSIFLSPKCYAISNKSGKDKILLKGLPKINSKDLTFNHFKEFLLTNNYTIKYHKPVHKILNKLLIKSLDTEFNTSFPFNKRRKVYDDENK